MDIGRFEELLNFRNASGWRQGSGLDGRSFLWIRRDCREGERRADELSSADTHINLFLSPLCRLFGRYMITGDPNRLELPRVANIVERISAEHQEIGPFARLDGAELILCVQTTRGRAGSRH